MSDSFYRLFEDRFRGSRELIKLRLRVYLPFVEPLCNFYKQTKAVDLGCGRGEWLELLQDTGFDALGVDLDDNMLIDCRNRNLKVQTCEAVSFLKRLPDASQVVVTGFHFAEHILFSDLQVLVEEALRVLKPGGLLILETQNPENIVVGATSFFLDPAHQRPIPPKLLFFLAEYYGFKKVKILRLQETIDLSSDNVLTLLDVLSGVSPDYAVVAQKEGKVEILAATNSAFEAEYGISLERLADRYIQQTKARAQQFKSERNFANNKIEALNARLGVAEGENSRIRAELLAQGKFVNIIEARTNKLQADLEAVLTGNQRLWQLAEAREQQIQSIYQSHSWCLTAPLRWFGNQARLLRQYGLALRFKALVKKVIRPFLRYAAVFLGVHPGLRYLFVDLIKRFGFYESLRSFYFRCSGQQDPKNYPGEAGQITFTSVTLDQLSPRARQIYAALKIASEHRRNDNH